MKFPKNNKCFFYHFLLSIFDPNYIEKLTRKRVKLLNSFEDILNPFSVYIFAANWNSFELIFIDTETIN